MNTFWSRASKWRPLSLAMVIGLSSLALGHSRLAAATYTVNSTEDRPDSDPLDGVCSATVIGACTLRAAIMQANGAAGADTIIVPAGLYQITRIAEDDDALGGDLDITDAVAIQGAGSAATILDGNGEVTNDRVLHILRDAAAVTLSGMTLRHGKVPTHHGGGILFAAPSLTLHDVHLENNTAGAGGGLAVVFANLANCDLIVIDAVIQNNTSTSGAGIWAETGQSYLRNVMLHGNTATSQGGGGFCGENALWRMSDSRIDHNTASSGGGLAIFGYTTVEHSEIFSNTANQGGGVDTAGYYPTALVECSIHDNHANADGGGIQAAGELILSHSVVEANSAVGNGGGIMIPGLNLPDSMIDLLIESSALTRNTAQFGGGLYYSETNDPSENHSVTFHNSTVANNQVSRDGGGICARNLARIFTSNTTIAANILYRPSGFNPARGGGVFLADTSYVAADNTLIGDNYFTNGTTTMTPDDCYTEPTTSFRSDGYNLIETTTNCSITGTSTGCIFNQDPRLDPAGAASNGGTTKTLALLMNSPAINVGNNSIAPIHDQRSYHRSGIADIGAFEFNGAPAMPVTLVSAVSRKGQPYPAEFDLNLPIMGSPGVECRSGGTAGAHSLILSFAADLADLGSVALTDGLGAVTYGSLDSARNQIRVTLAHVANGQLLTLRLSDVSDVLGNYSNTVSFTFGVLLGDTNGNGSVSASDISQIKSKSGQTVDGSNFRADVNINGSISASDIALVKSKSGSSLPP